MSISPAWFAVAFLVVVALVTTACVLFSLWRQEAAAVEFWRKHWNETSDLNHRLINGAQVQLVNVCRNCRIQLRERDRVDGRYAP